MPTYKRHSRFGIKKFELCDSLSGYVIHVELYAGKDFTIQSDMGQAYGVVMDLMQKANVLNKGYHLFTDNFYTKPILAQTLLQAKTLLTGTIRHNSRGLPALAKKMNVGEMVNYRRQGMLLVAFREKKSQRKPVLMLSTSAAAGKVQVQTAAGLKQKPKCLAADNQYMGGVDISARKIYHVSHERPTKRYWKKVFFNVLDIALLSSYKLYKGNTGGGLGKTHRDFFLCSIVESLCAAEDPPISLPPAMHCR